MLLTAHSIFIYSYYELGVSGVWVMGLDIGSVGAKAVALTPEGVQTATQPTGWSPRESGLQLIDRFVARWGEPAALIATGYGRKMMGDRATRQVTEISCHAKGAAWMAPGCHAVIDIGGQDSKVMTLDRDGTVRDFLMNDRCAAGTGRFIQMAALALGYELSDLLALPEEGEAVPLSSTCAVFAETELVSLLASGKSRESLGLGVLRSVASRTAGLARRISWTGDAFFTGGLARSSTVTSLLAHALGCEVKVHPLSPWAGALGAALIGQEGVES